MRRRLDKSHDFALLLQPAADHFFENTLTAFGVIALAVDDSQASVTADHRCTDEGRDGVARLVNEETVQVNVILHCPFTAIELAGNIRRHVRAAEHEAVIALEKHHRIAQV